MPKCPSKAIKKEEPGTRSLFEMDGYEEDEKSSLYVTGIKFTDLNVDRDGTFNEPTIYIYIYIYIHILCFHIV